MTTKKEEYNYCTLFDSHYLIRGMALYESIKKTGDQFYLYIFALDAICENILNTLSLDNVKIIGVDDFENEDLKKIKEERTVAEYCWTCSSFAIDYILSNYHVDELTYLDADLYFFDKPSVLINEFRNSGRDVLLMEHRYSNDCLKKEKLYGKYNVEFMTFRKTEKGLSTLKWWKDKCKDWCYDRLEEGKFGDQKYLEYFEKLFSSTYVCNNIGGGVAPWNINQYCITIDEEKRNPLINNKPVIFYHFHNLHWYGNNNFDPGQGYGDFSESIINILYKPYIKILNKCSILIKSVNHDFSYLKDEKKIEHTPILDDMMLYRQDVESVFDGLNLSSAPVFIWGAGNNGKRIYKFLNNYGIQIDGVVDSKTDIIVSDFVIQDKNVLKDNKYFVIVSPYNYRDSIVAQLLEWGYNPKSGFITIDELERKLGSIRNNR